MTMPGIWKYLSSCRDHLKTSEKVKNKINGSKALCTYTFSRAIYPNGERR